MEVGPDRMGWVRWDLECSDAAADAGDEEFRPALFIGFSGESQGLAVFDCACVRCHGALMGENTQGGSHS
jgi:hypothetical protein